MESIERMREMVDDVVETYAVRIGAVSSLLAESYGGIDKARHEWDEIHAKLRDALATKASLRHRDFERLMSEMISFQEQRELEVKNTLQETLKSQKKFAGFLKEALARSDLATMRSIQHEIEVGMNAIRETINSFHREQELLIRKLRALLENRDSLTVAEFRNVLKQIQNDLRILAPERDVIQRAG